MVVGDMLAASAMSRSARFSLASLHTSKMLAAAIELGDLLRTSSVVGFDLTCNTYPSTNCMALLATCFAAVMILKSSLSFEQKRLTRSAADVRLSITSISVAWDIVVFSIRTRTVEELINHAIVLTNGG